MRRFEAYKHVYIDLIDSDKQLIFIWVGDGYRHGEMHLRIFIIHFKLNFTSVILLISIGGIKTS